MKEKVSAVDLAEEYVARCEDTWVKEWWVFVEEMEKRAKGSKTLIAWKEYHSAKDRLSRELDRLCYKEPNPNED